ncbi:MAG TPA: 16S rRNA (cytosine(1402)-N(4))-methyltransferase RsmH [Candidatus Saccharibacteria bacterium]|jgi:16S rRNA (cytosine1402-N4)-methyltransferase|nr:16S rRNA (cytosine(1402)-N(4))-methyltransferase RsmH [Candidatus Saccharibacteria bacterium]HMR38050.1 16S rRNA (cytosine(1402)-N(4))-methyltransferase RsmH [Candidatus Saccharibacteria bacterium]
MSIKEHPPQHVPVLLDASLELLCPKEGERYLDLTAGYGGHAKAFLDRTDNYLTACLVDRDSMAIEALHEFQAKGVRLMHDDFASAAGTLVAEQQTFDVILVDLGVSSPQLDYGARGFSFMRDGPLDMRMDNRQELTAEQYVNTVKLDSLVDIIRKYGEEPLGVARRYAKAIVDARPLHTTGQLAEVIRQVHVGKWQKIHPATRTFQAIRIEVNQELRQIEELLPLLPALLNKGGRVGIISFHSLEDRLIKRFFAEQQSAGYEAELQLVNKKPRSGHEDDHNPRSRSAKLRVAVKI